MTQRQGFFDATGFPFAGVLERNAPAIMEELDRLLIGDRFTPWPERGLYGKGWDVFGLYFFEKRIPEHCALCPGTVAIIEQVPGMTTAGFSRLAPGTHIRPHEGFTDQVLRCHLGLIVPPRCRLRVGSETRHWEANKCLIFDDTLEHEAWNESDTDRVVLLLDFEKQT